MRKSGRKNVFCRAHCRLLTSVERQPQVRKQPKMSARSYKILQAAASCSLRSTPRHLTKMLRVAIFLLFISPSLISATISPAFREFVRNTYGAAVERRIARDEFPDGRGSFGGGIHAAGSRTV